MGRQVMETLKAGFEILLWLVGICFVVGIYWRVDKWMLSEFGTRYLRMTSKDGTLGRIPS